MICKHPDKSEIPQLLTLWKSAFGEWNGFWEMFLETAFSPERCRCVREGSEITAALTWLDCTCNGRKLAYIYAVVTHPDHRGKGLCRRLLADTHALLKARGYAAALLVPAESGLREMYEKLGYETCTFVTEFSCEAGASPVSLRAMGPGEFAALRQQFLPADSVVQEGENLPFLARQFQFYAGEGFLLTAYTDGEALFAPEFLGNSSAAPGILRTLNAKSGTFRCPGGHIPFAMFHPLTEETVTPAYFGFAFD